MKIKAILAAASLALLPLTASAATVIVPAVGSVPGANGSQWQSELSLHNSSNRSVSLSLRLHAGQQTYEPAVVAVGPQGTLNYTNVVTQLFGLRGVSGALEIVVADADVRRVAIGSRTFNSTPAGEFGQDVPATDVTSAARAGEVVVLPTPSTSDYRFNFGIYAVDVATVNWEVFRNGQTVASRTATYRAGEQAQYNAGFGFIGAETMAGDVVRAKVVSGRAVIYGSAVNNLSGDPTFVPGLRTRDSISINLLGIDLDEDGDVDLADADKDGVVDTVMEVVTSLYPAYFRVVVEGEFGETPALELVSSPGGNAILTNQDGSIQFGAPGDFKGKTGEIRLRATIDNSSTIIVIPVRFR